MPMKTAMDLFVHELSDIRSAEGIILGMLKTAAGAGGTSGIADQGRR